MKRVTVYIDGFNLYYGALRKRRGVKWLDLAALADALMPGAEVTVRYFTARVTDHPGDGGVQARQSLYLRAIDSLDRVEVHLGHFTTHRRWMARADTLPGQDRFVEVLRTDEKGSDVNLATWLLVDGVTGAYDEALVISDDSDLAEPIKQAALRYGPVHIVSPRAKRLYALTAFASSWQAIDSQVLERCQLPSPLTLPSGRVVNRPVSW